MRREHSMEQDQDSAAGRGYGAILSTPSQATIDQARITGYARWLADQAGVGTDGSYAGLWQWSVSHLPEFWSSIWDYFEVLGERSDEPVLQGGPMPHVTWFAGTSINYAR